MIVYQCLTLIDRPSPRRSSSTSDNPRLLFWFALALACSLALAAAHWPLLTAQTLGVAKTAHASFRCNIIKGHFPFSKCTYFRVMAKNPFLLFSSSNSWWIAKRERENNTTMQHEFQLICNVLQKKWWKIWLHAFNFYISNISIFASVLVLLFNSNAGTPS